MKCLHYINPNWQAHALPQPIREIYIYPTETWSTGIIIDEFGTIINPVNEPRTEKHFDSQIIEINDQFIERIRKQIVERKTLKHEIIEKFIGKGF